MKFVEWIHYREDGNYKDILDVDAELQKLWNPKKRWIILEDDENVIKYSKEHNVSIQEAVRAIETEDNKLPTYIDEEKANHLKECGKACDQKLREYCIEEKIFITDQAHQISNIPVFEDNDGQKYLMLYSLRAWSELMANVWNKILDTDRLDYLSFYCNNRDDEVDNYLKNLSKAEVEK